MKNLTGFKTLLKREIARFMRIKIQTFVPPIMNAALFMIIFGFFIGPRIPQIEGIDFILFFIPGLITLNMITSSYSNSAFSLFLMKFVGHVSDILTAPMSYKEIVLGFTLGGVIKGLLVGILIYLTSLLFKPVIIFNLPLLLFFLILTSFVFASLGLTVGLWASEFEHVEIFTIFLITPLTFLGGVFHSIKFLPPILQTITWWNPFFHIVNGIRYSMIGLNEGNILIGIIMILLLSVASFSINLHLFRKGYKLRT